MDDIVERIGNYQVCLDPNVIICDRRTVDEAVSEIRTLRTRLAQWEKVAEEMAGALGKCINYLENTEGELGIMLGSAENARATLTAYRNMKGQSDGND